MDGFSAFIGAVALFVAAAIFAIGFSAGQNSAADYCDKYGQFEARKGQFYQCAGPRQGTGL
jgi:hypothetical protein